MSTAEMYRGAVAAEATTALQLPVRDVVVSLNDRTVVRGTTEEMYAHLRAMRDLAALSFETDSLDRESAADIWGFHGAE
jgi:hypothetical protein